MKKKLIVSLHDGIAALSPENTLICHAPMEGAGALCAGNAGIFCADGSGAIWRFERKTLMLQSLGCGGPGICDMKLSACGTRLYALLGEADCVLMSDAHTGSPLAVNRCGCNPKAMACGRELLAIAGGESGCVHLFQVHTLESLGKIVMPGPVYSVALCGDTVYALCLTAQMSTLFVAWRENSLAVYPLSGMPGCIMAAGDRLYTASEGKLHVYSMKTGMMAGLCSVPGRPSRIIVIESQMFLYDPLSECVFVAFEGNSWRKICSGARDICCV